MSETTTSAPAPAEGSAPAAAKTSALKEAAEREVVLSTLLDEVKTAYNAARAETQKLLDEAKASMGVHQIKPTLPDGTELATVSHRAGSAEARVTDDEAFLQWVIKTVPSEVDRRFVTEVRPAFAKMILDALTAAGVTDWADAEGEIHSVPGVKIVPSRTKTHSVRFAKDGQERIMRAWRERTLPARILPALAAGEEGDR